MNKYRISNKSNVIRHGPKTEFTAHKFDPAAGAYLFDGVYYAPGWNRSDDRCADFAELSNNLEA